MTEYQKAETLLKRAGFRKVPLKAVYPKDQCWKYRRAFINTNMPNAIAPCGCCIGLAHIMKNGRMFLQRRACANTAPEYQKRIDGFTEDFDSFLALAECAAQNVVRELMMMQDAEVCMCKVCAQAVVENMNPDLYDDPAPLPEGVHAGGFGGGG